MSFKQTRSSQVDSANIPIDNKWHTPGNLISAVLATQEELIAEPPRALRESERGAPYHG